MEQAYLDKMPIRWRITLSPGTLLKFLLTVILVLALCCLLVNYDHYIWGGKNRPLLYHLFNLDWEHNVPSLFSALNLFFSALLLLSLSQVERKEGGPWRFHYLSLGIVFIFLSCDEFFSFHERLSAAINRDFHTDSVFVLGSVLLAVVLLPPLVVYFWRWLLLLDRRTALMVILSAVIYLAGAVGMELVGISYARALGTKDDLLYQLLATIEETLEMLGIALFNYTLVELWLQQKPSQEEDFCS